MKVIVRSDDYGFTKGIIESVIDTLENDGLITITGLFTNMPWAQYAYERIKPYTDKVCLGIDINCSTGPCVADKSLLPVLVNQETGWFYQTTEIRKMHPEGVSEYYKPYEEVLIEAEAQVKKFIEITGRLPEYLTSHSTWGQKGYLAAIRDIAHKYGIKFTYEYEEKYHFTSIFPKREGNPYSIENQLKSKVPGTLEELEKHKDAEIIQLNGHCGWLTPDLLKFSSCTIDRIQDYEVFNSPEIKQWLKDHDAQMISYRDLD